MPATHLCIRIARRHQFGAARRPKFESTWRHELGAARRHQFEARLWNQIHAAWRPHVWVEPQPGSIEIVTKTISF